MASLPEAVTLLIMGGNPYPLLESGGFSAHGRWIDFLLGNGTWNYQFMADGVSDPCATHRVFAVAPAHWTGRAARLHWLA